MMLGEKIGPKTASLTDGISIKRSNMFSRVAFARTTRALKLISPQLANQSAALRTCEGFLSCSKMADAGGEEKLSKK